MEQTELNYLLHSAIRKGKKEMVKELLNRGADVHARKDEALRKASEYGHTDIVTELLDRGADVHARKDEALRSAAMNGHTEIVEELLDRGADVHAIEKELLDRGAAAPIQGNIGFILAAYHEHKEVIDLFYQHLEKEKNHEKEQRDLYNEPISDRYVAWMKEREKEQGKNKDKDKKKDKPLDYE